MLYQPNFCCNCGEKIERTEWNLLTSRRFCEPCASEKGVFETGARLVVGVGILGIVFGFGNFWAGFSSREATIVQPVGLTGSKKTAGFEQGKTADPKFGSPSSAAVASTDTDSRQSSPESARRIGVKPDQPIYYCGALTKKGTPCSRKVKAKGMRCFQHEGRPEAPPMD